MSGRTAKGGIMITEGARLKLDPIGCRAHGLCAEVLPELIELDEWGYPILYPESVPAHLLAEARRAAAACPSLALRVGKAPG